MMILLYILIALLVLLIALLLLRLRVRLYLLQDQKSLFAGLGRSGVALDLAKRTGEARLFGFKLRTFDMEELTEQLKENRREIAAVTAEPPKTAKEIEESDWREGFIAIRQSVSPLFNWFVSLLKATRFEELRGDIKAGFDSPDLTGQTYGCYHALIGAVPALNGRLNYYPDWEGLSFTGELRASLAMPFYSLIGRTIQLVFRLPIRKLKAIRAIPLLFELPLRNLIKLAIGTKKVGDPHAK